MDIGVVIETASTGCWRYLYLLLENIKRFDEYIKITIYYRDVETCPFEINRFLTEFGIALKKMDYVGLKRRRKPSFINNIVNILYIPGNWLRKHKNKMTEALLLRSYEGHDVLFYPWPYRAKYYDIKKPMFFVPHDFIFSHYFGHHVLNYYNRDLWDSNKKKIGGFLENGKPIVSSNYVANELRNVFPDYVGEISVIPLSSLTLDREISEAAIAAVLNKYDINGKYILFPTNNMHHKNQGQVIGAFYYIKKELCDIKLIIIGYDTDGVRVQCNSPFYCDHVSEEDNYDIKSLGLVSEDDLIILFKASELIINASFCEAACGSGLDAWSLGVPTAISDIPPYVEQVNQLGVRTAFFNPRNAIEIAATVISLIRDRGLAEENARISKEMMESYNWQKVAEQYVGVFRKGLEQAGAHR